MKDRVKEIVDYCADRQFIERCMFLQVYEEFLTFAYWVNGFKPNNILEIGTRGCTFWILTALSTGKKIAVDKDDNKPLLEENPNICEWSFIQGDTKHTDIYKQIVSECNEYDLIFIDGDHTYEGVKHDFEKYKPLLSKRGYIVFHDIDSNNRWRDNFGVYRFWNELEGGSKIEIVCTKASGRTYLSKTHMNDMWNLGLEENITQNYGGIGLWKPI